MSRTSGAIGLVLAGLLSMANALPAYAESNAGDRAAAESLFESAVKLLDAGKPAEACPKLEESQKLDPGVGTLLYLADCYQQMGRTASAWATFRDAAYAAKDANQADREKTASDLADKLKPKLSYMALQVDAKDTTGLVIKRDGETLSQGLWSTPIPLDPGDHKLEASAPGKVAWSKSVTVPKGPGTIKVTVPALADAPATATPAPLPVAEMPAESPKEAEQPPAQQTPPTTPEDKGKGGGGMQKTLGWVGIGIGAGSLIGSGVFSLMALSSDKSADKNCLPDDPKQCSPAGISDGKSAKNKANVATILGGAGLALAATGVVLVITAPSDQPSGSTASMQLIPEVGYDSAGISLNGAW